MGRPKPAVVALIAVISAVAAACEPSSDPKAQQAGGSSSPATTLPASVSGPPASPVVSADPTTWRQARRAIDHVVFIVKENRTFDHLFGRFEGADGVTAGVTCDGTVVPLRRAQDDTPGASHGFTAGLVSINGGRMNCFDRIEGGKKLESYVQYTPEQIPNYWRYAEEFTLGDRFFSSTYGPTFIEHMFIIAAQTDRYVDNQRPLLGQAGTDGDLGGYCEDETELIHSFPRFSAEAEAAVFEMEEDARVDELVATWIERWPCHDVETLPDLLEDEGISWAYYTTDSPYYQALKAIPHIRFGPMWRRVIHPLEFVPDVEDGRMPKVSWVIPPTPESDHPDLGRLCPARTGPCA